tara:strand:+ start:167 stop:406 length:240 start_codon:yes stop_codon:yes gene_type:complete
MVSEQTKADLDLALTAHIADLTEGAYLTDYFLVAASTETEDFGTGRTVYCFVTTNNQPAHISMGLLAYAQDYGEAEDDE